MDEKKTRNKTYKPCLPTQKTLKLNIIEIPPTGSRVRYTPRTALFDVTPRCNSNYLYCLASDRMKDPAGFVF